MEAIKEKYEYEYETGKELIDLAIEILDERFGAGFGKAHPTDVISLVNSLVISHSYYELDGWLDKIETALINLNK